MEGRINKIVAEHHKGILKEALQIRDTDQLHTYLKTNLKFKLKKQDLAKKPRQKNTLPTADRCQGRRADGEQCTRQRRDGNYCKTHASGLPHGQVDADIISKDVIATDINGIIYFIDSNDNIFSTEDVMAGKINPKLIGKFNRANNVVTYINS